MSNDSIFFALFVLAVSAFFFGRNKAVDIEKTTDERLHSLPRHHGYFAASTTFLPGLFIFALWLGFGSVIIENIVFASLDAGTRTALGDQPDLIINRIRLAVANGNAFETDPVILAAAEDFNALYGRGVWAAFFLTMGMGCLGLAQALWRTRPGFRARNKYETILRNLLMMSSAVATVVTVGIVGSLLFESIQFFREVPLSDFLFGLQWSPQTALREDQVGSSGAFGAIPLFAGTLLISLIAMSVAGPVGLFVAIFLNQYATDRMRQIAKPMIEILAGIPTVVYGFFAAIIVAPAFREMGITLGLDIAAESAIAAGIVMGIMIIPFVSSLSDDAIAAVPNTLAEGSLALGATPSETITKVLLPAALPGIVGAFLLAVSRAIGETMIVVMAVGMRPNLTLNPFEAVTTVTVQIVALLTGDQEFNTAKTLSAFALGLVLFVITLVLNIVALGVVRRYREVYD